MRTKRGRPIYFLCVVVEVVDVLARCKRLRPNMERLTRKVKDRRMVDEGGVGEDKCVCEVTLLLCNAPLLKDLH